VDRQGQDGIPHRQGAPREPGGIAAIPGGVEHEGWCHEDTEVVDIFAPPREDFLDGGLPTWLREKAEGVEVRTKP
jgi:hypothetical protein